MIDGNPRVVEAEGIRKSFGPFEALRGVDLAISAGERCALFGPNGAGKTTLLKILSGLARPTAGGARVLGRDPRDPSVRARVGYLGHGGWLHDALSAEENLAFYGALYGTGDLPARIGRVLAEVGLEARRHDRVSTYSRGLRQRLAIARALLHEPTLLFLDEPFTGLDRAAALALAEFLRRIATEGGRTVLAVTHELDVGLDLASRVLVLAGGRLVLDRPSAGLRRDELESVYLDAVAGESRAASRTGRAV